MGEDLWSTLAAAAGGAGWLEGWAYYLVCGALFTVAGFASGYFIWRKGHMQTVDAEAEVRRAEGELAALREDFETEERELAGGSGGPRSS